MRIAIAITLLAAGCATISDPEPKTGGEGGGGGDGSGDGSGSGSDNDGCKIEGSTIGIEGAMILLGDRSVTFHDWVAKTGEPEYVGFSITIQGADALGYVVKSGTEQVHSTATTWINPAGPDGGSAAKGISNVDFCENGGGSGGGSGSGSGSGVIN